MQDATLSPSPSRAGVLDRDPAPREMPWIRWAVEDAAKVTSSNRTRDEPDGPHGPDQEPIGHPESSTPAQPDGSVPPRPTISSPASETGDSTTAADPIEVLSHELRSPITTIHLGTKVLRSRRRVSEPVKEAVVEAVELEAERLLRLVEDLLAVARHEGGREALPVQPLLLQRALPPVLEAEARIHEGTPIRALLPEDLPPAVADEAALSHVVRNVIANAVRFAPPGSPVEVVAEARDGVIELRIADRGPGIDPAEADRLFEPFYRSARTAGAGGGAGLGLTAARRLLAAMGGTIEARPRAGGGALVVIRFTRTDPATEH
ncbi:MAG TPA: HAMP domain-containing sensor histidine kinase [Candidatus Limnocylindrales bacterium]|nr:HAMP domain-containing sensor histidine kinase [Candidatus Limnocylindrales bacterium]